MNVVTVASTQVQTATVLVTDRQEIFKWGFIVLCYARTKIYKKSVTVSLTVVGLLNATNNTAVGKIGISAYLYSVKQTLHFHLKSNVTFINIYFKITFSSLRCTA